MPTQRGIAKSQQHRYNGINKYSSNPIQGSKPRRNKENETNKK